MYYIILKILFHYIIHAILTFSACPGVIVVAKDGEKKCYVVASGNQTVGDNALTFYQARQYCYSMGGQLPIIKNAKEQNYLLEGIEKYKTDHVSRKLFALYEI